MTGEERDKLIALEVLFKEKWTSHDKRSEEIWAQVQAQVKAIFTKLDFLQCQTHAERMKGLSKQMATIWTVVCLILGGCIYGFWFMIRG